ncbi:uncharacterized protein LOC118501543 [Phyllostomus discolor]|uniref:Uncharacterized protein LOC118501543 n=1 Tax=Phyllostomus discolor TaxID=89673 RepID=A0A7E6E3S2_9CHIR|nr:uncharacterized protein LOC118501543 [Phyllostomus discolor]
MTFAEDPPRAPGPSVRRVEGWPLAPSEKTDAGWVGCSGRPGRACGGRREGPAAGAGGAFRPAARGGLVLNFRSAGHVLYTASPLARLHTCTALEDAATPAGRPVRVSFPLCGEARHRCWAGGVLSSWARPCGPAGLRPALWTSLRLPSGGTPCPRGNLETLPPPFCGACPGFTRPPLQGSTLGLPPPPHLGVWLPRPFLRLLGLPVSCWLCLVVSCCLVSVRPPSGSLCLAGLLRLPAPLSPPARTSPWLSLCTLLHLCLCCLSPLEFLRLPAPLRPDQYAGRMCHVCFPSVSVFPPSASLCLFLTLDGASPPS